MNKPTPGYNPIHSTLLAMMIRSSKGSPHWPLARNITEASIERAARRWAPR